MLFAAIATSGINSWSKRTKSNNDEQQSLLSNYRNYPNFRPGRQNNRSEPGWFCLTNYAKMEEEKGRRNEQEERTQCSAALFCSAEGGCSFQHLRNRRGPNKWLARYWLASVSQASELCTGLIDLWFFSQSSHNFARFMFRIFSFIPNTLSPLNLRSRMDAHNPATAKLQEKSI